MENKDTITYTDADKKTSNFKCSGCSKEPTGQINVARFISRLDECFKTNDLEKAGNVIEFWENEATTQNDKRGLLSVINEELGFYRRTNDKEKGLRAVKIALDILSSEENMPGISCATIYINLATTLKSFGQAENGIPYYDKAEEVYIKYGKQNTFEYATLLNNKGSALADLSRYSEAEESFNKAMAILDKEGNHDGEIAVSLINLAHLIYDRDGTDGIEKVEQTLDKAWEYINSKRQVHDSNYAYILSKCAPSLRYFNRIDEAEALEEVSQEIYGNNIK